MVSEAKSGKLVLDIIFVLFTARPRSTIGLSLKSKVLRFKILFLSYLFNGILNLLGDTNAGPYLQYGAKLPFWPNVEPKIIPKTSPLYLVYSPSGDPNNLSKYV